MMAPGPIATILLVEDQEVLRALASRILERGGFRVLAVASGGAALAMLDQHGDAINVLLSDVVMPDLNGITLAQEVRARFPHMKIILMSGYGTDHLNGVEVQQWMDKMVLKPFTAEALVAAVRQVTCDVVTIERG